MILETRQSKAAAIVERWVNHYGEDERHMVENARGMLGKLRALGPFPEPNAVDNAIGNTGWTMSICGECSKCVDVVVVVGEEADTEDSFTRLCIECVVYAVSLCPEKVVHTIEEVDHAIRTVLSAFVFDDKGDAPFVQAVLDKLTKAYQFMG